MSVTRLGVSLLKVVATMDSPASHHGTDPAGDEELGSVLARALSEEQRRDETDEQGGDDDQPIDELQFHVLFRNFSSRQGFQITLTNRRRNGQGYLRSRNPGPERPGNPEHGFGLFPQFGAHIPLVLARPADSD